jgi:hypothetical protein
MATRFPIDYDSLKKGDVIPAELLEKIAEAPRSTPKYQLKVLAFQQQIMDEMRARGNPVTVIVRGGEIVVLTDAEASTYNAERLGAHLHGVMRAHERSQAVDVANLDDEQKKVHTRRVEVGGKFVQAIIDTGRKLKLPAYTRKTPGLPNPADVPTEGK